MNTIRDRIREIIEAENITPAKFADNLDIGRAVISHILNGRNNASLDVIMKILAVMPQINSDWLLTGKGLMYLDGAKKNNSVRDIQQDLFSDNSINQNNQPEKR
ncbi:MAG: helix-turn-helix domain-containing protein [Dysgonomonas sp.]